MNNYVIDVTVTPVSSTEPITLAEAKAYLRVTDTAQDTVITNIITASRQAIERVTQLALVRSNVVALLCNNYGGIELPFQPYISGLTFKDKEGVNITAEIEIDGLQFKTVTTQKDWVRSEFVGGYSDLPMDLKFAIYDQIAFMWENRGDQVDTASVCEKAWRTCLRYTRKPLLV